MSAEEGSNKLKGRVCTTPELEKDYTMLVGCRRSKEWKPKLETIKEKEKEKKKHRTFGIKRKEKGQSPSNGKGAHKSEKQEKQVGVNPQPAKVRGGKDL